MSFSCRLMIACLMTLGRTPGEFNKSAMTVFGEPEIGGVSWKRKVLFLEIQLASECNAVILSPMCFYIYCLWTQVVFLVFFVFFLSWFLLVLSCAWENFFAKNRMDTTWWLWWWRGFAFELMSPRGEDLTINRCHHGVMSLVTSDKILIWERQTKNNHWMNGTFLHYSHSFSFPLHFIQKKYFFPMFN